MGVKAHKIIETIFTFFMKNAAMLPIEYQQRIEFEAQKLSSTNLPETNNSKFHNIIHQYLYERIQEFDEQNNNELSKNYFLDPLKGTINENEENNVDLLINVLKNISDFYDKKSKEEGKPDKWDRELKWDSESEIEKFINEKGSKESYNALCMHISKARIVADYIASMTDRMAEKKYNEIVSSSTSWSKVYGE